MAASRTTDAPIPAWSELTVPAPDTARLRELFDRLGFVAGAGANATNTIINTIEAGVIGEADGLMKYRTPEDLQREKLRQEGPWHS